jgi:hypothetical protein
MRIRTGNGGEGADAMSDVRLSSTLANATIQEHCIVGGVCELVTEGWIMYRTYRKASLGSRGLASTQHGVGEITHLT